MEVYCIGCKKETTAEKLRLPDGTLPFIYDGAYECEPCKSKKAIHSLWVVREKFVDQAIVCLETGYLSRLKFKEIIGLDDLNDINEFLEKRKKNGITLNEYKMQKFLKSKETP
jgi:hypothetical protein